MALSNMTERFEDVWTIEERLGKGVYGHIFEVSHKYSQRVEAVKVLGICKDNLRQAAHTEAMIWSRIPQHKNIVKLHEIYQDENDMFLVMEKCECNALSRLARGFRIREVIPVFQQMLTSLAQLHSANIAHRDIKLENFLITGKKLECVKLCDFGFATFVPHGQDLKGVCGTPPYMSPEMLTSTHNTKTDIWSMGVCFYFLLSGGCFPYESKERSAEAMKKAIIEGSQLTHFDAPKTITVEARQLALTLLDRIATNRVTAAQALQQPLFRSARCRGTSPTFSEQSTLASEQERQGCKLPQAALSDNEDDDIPEDIILESPVRNMVAKKPISAFVASKRCFDLVPAEVPTFF